MLAEGAPGIFEDVESKVSHCMVITTGSETKWLDGCFSEPINECLVCCSGTGVEMLGFKCLV